MIPAMFGRLRVAGDAAGRQVGRQTAYCYRHCSQSRQRGRQSKRKTCAAPAQCGTRRAIATSIERVARSKIGPAEADEG